MIEHKREPMLLLDTTGSMTLATSATDPKPRHETVKQAMFAVVKQLCALDSGAKRKRHGGGLRTITFAGGKAFDRGDFRPDNLATKWDELEWDGDTHIVPGWEKLLKVHQHEFGKHSDVVLIALVITDGIASDLAKFEEHLASLHGLVFVLVAIVGYGAEHDKCYTEFRQLADRPGQDHVRVIPLADAPNQGDYVASVFRGFLESDDVYTHDFELHQQQLQQRPEQKQMGPPRQQQPFQQPFSTFVQSSSSSPAPPPTYASAAAGPGSNYANNNAPVYYS